MSAPGIDILILDHAHEGLSEQAPYLEEQGYRVEVCTEITESLAWSKEKERPGLVVCAPLVLDRGGVETEIITRLTRGTPLPVILIVNSMAQLEKAAGLPITLRDFLTTPVEPKEFLLRIKTSLEIHREMMALHQRTEELSGQVIRDFKTGLYNARHFAQELRREFQRVNRTHRPLALLMLDLDNFKEINDTTEYAFGDQVLARFAQALLGNIREVDVAARFGGDEFMILLPGTTPAEAIQVASRIRNVTSKLEISDGKYSKHISVSIGVDCYNGQTTSSPEELRTRANRALQDAKKRGKNCIWLYAPPATEGNPFESGANEALY